MITLSDSLKLFAAALEARYKLKREIGRGGMAVVYLAEDLRHHRQVAIKVFQPELAGTVGHERFLREIQVAANLTHPHILPLHDSGEAEGLLYYVMPYVQGETLRERLRNVGQLPLQEALRIAGEVAGALGYAHRQGLVHRDIKPENVMLTSGHALVMDFGICRAVGEASSEDSLTRAGFTLGTPAYMSPEQWTMPDRVAEPSDIYSLGCVLYEMLVGEPPFTGPTAAVMLARHTQQEMPSVRVVRPDVPEALEAVLRQALAKIPGDRFASAYELGEALEASSTQPLIVTIPKQLPIAGLLAGKAKYAAALLVLVALGVSVFFLGTRRGTPEQTITRNRVVVDLFENKTGNDRLGVLGSMAADWLIEGLQRIEVVDVVPSASAMPAAQFIRGPAGQGRDPIKSLSEETGAGTVIAGSYYLVEGDSVEFRLAILGYDGKNTRSRSTIPPVRASSAAASEAFKQLNSLVLGAVLDVLDERESFTIDADLPPNFEAYRAFSVGLEKYLNNQFQEALPELYRAHQLDSTFVRPLLYAAFCHSNLGQAAKVETLTKQISARRHELTKYNRYWLEYLEARVRGDNLRALAAMREASKLAPDSKATYNRAFMAQITGRAREALEAFELLVPERGAMRGWLPYWNVLADVRHRLGDFKGELDAGRRAAELYSERPDPKQIQVSALAAERRVGDLNDLIDKVTRSPGDTLSPGHIMAFAAVELGRHRHDAESRAMFDRALNWFKTHPPADPNSEQYLRDYAEVLHNAQRWAEAKQVVDQLVLRDTARVQYRTWAGVLAAGNGQREEALKVERWLAGLPQVRLFHTRSNTYQRARIWALLGDSLRAVQLVQQAFEEGYGIPRHPDVNFEKLRDYHELQRLYQPRDYTRKAAER